MRPTDEWSWLGTGGGEAAELIRRVDWSATPLGRPSSWSPVLKGIVSTMLHARQPMFLWWGPELVQFYNDGYTPSFGVGRHPAAMGQRGRDCWADIWPIIGPEIAGVVASGQATFHEDALVPIFRNGRMEEVYWTYGYSPVLDVDGSIAGVLVVVTETTTRVVALRRLRTAHALSAALAAAADGAVVARALVDTLTATREDAPWALVYRTSGATPAHELVAVSGIDPDRAARVVARLAARGGAPTGFEQVELGPELALPGDPWPEPSTSAIVLPVGSTSSEGGPAVLVMGASPRLPFDRDYQDHLAIIGRHLEGTNQRIRAADARRAAEEARANLLLQAPVAAALLLGPTWRYEIANPLYTRMVGREVVGRAWHDCFPELHGSPVDAILRRVYEGGEMFVASEQMIALARESDGVVEERYFDFNMIPVRSRPGAIDGMMVVAVEITAQVSVRRDLERTAAERGALVRELEWAARAKDEFLAMLGHELRNPLAAIVTALSVTREREGAAGYEREVIERQAGHLVRLVDDLLDLSRITHGTVELRPTTSEVAALVAHAREMTGGVFQQRGHRLHVHVDDALLWHGDATRLEQVMVNLLTNAARYTPPGGEVELRAGRAGDELVVCVRDNGRGIDAELLPRLFEPFVQGRRDVDREEGGLGLGLAVVKGIVALHGGTVTAGSEGVGRGSRFEIRLPGVQAEPAAESEPRPAAAPALRRARRVLVVDDNEDAAVLLAELLRLRGHEVAIAHDGFSALTVDASFEPDAAFLDIGLPRMDGYELVGRLRERGRTRACRFFALTGYGQPSDVQRALAAGFTKLLVKPVDLAVLQRTLDELG
jgi:signal transduction histidine kinase